MWLILMTYNLIYGAKYIISRWVALREKCVDTPAIVVQVLQQKMTDGCKYCIVTADTHHVDWA